MATSLMDTSRRGARAAPNSFTSMSSKYESQPSISCWPMAANSMANLSLRRVDGEMRRSSRGGWRYGEALGLNDNIKMKSRQYSVIELSLIHI